MINSAFSLNVQDIDQQLPISLDGQERADFIGKIAGIAMYKGFKDDFLFTHTNEGFIYANDNDCVGIMGNRLTGEVEFFEYSFPTRNRRKFEAFGLYDATMRVINLLNNNDENSLSGYLPDLQGQYVQLLA